MVYALSTAAPPHMSPAPSINPLLRLPPAIHPPSILHPFALYVGLRFPIVALGVLSGFLEGVDVEGGVGF
jgi:hypothetical protein